MRKLTELERQDLINKIFNMVRKTQHSLGTAWLEHMTDEELKAKYEEVCGNAE